MTNKKLYRSEKDKMFLGVCGGLGDFFEVDSTIIRLATAIIIIFSGFVPGFLLYIVAALIMPVAPGAVAATTEETKV